MAIIKYSITSLLQSAQDLENKGSPTEDCNILYQRLIDLFLSKEVSDRKKERQQLLHIIDTLMPLVDLHVRDHTIRRLCAYKNPPIDLILHIVMDDAERVAPLLRVSKFDEDDFLTLIETASRDHHHILAERRDLPTNAWIALSRIASKERSHVEKVTLATAPTPKIPEKATPTLRLVQTDKLVSEDPLSLAAYSTKHNKTAREKAVEETEHLLRQAEDIIKRYKDNDPEIVRINAERIEQCRKTLQKLLEDT